MGNLNPACRWPNCGCKTENNEPCKYENPDFYIRRQMAMSEQAVKARIAAIEARLATVPAFREGDGKFMGDVLTELARARMKFPSATASTVALMEEVGELAQAMLKYSAGKWPHSRVHEEAVQVCVMAMRVALEGDESLAKAGYTEPGE